MKTNVKAKSPLRTHEGAESPRVSAIAQLRRSLMANMLFESGFYESGEDNAKRIAALIPQVSFKDGAQAAMDAREKFKLRHAPLFVTRELLRYHKGREVGDLVANVIQRPDELTELLALYWKDTPNAPLTRQLKVGLARAFKKFKPWQLAKYNSDGAVKLRDVLFMTHVRPKRRKQEGNAIVVPAINKPNYKRGEVYRHPGSTLEHITNQTLVSPDTWEVALSSGADKRETFTRLLTEHKLGALALLRNLRNMIQSGVDEDLIRQELATVDMARVLPFRFIAAAKHAPRLTDALEAAMFRCIASMPKLQGKTALLVDHSMSMNNLVSAKSEITRFDAAAALAMILRENAERCRVFTFSDRMTEVPPIRGFGLLNALNAVRLPNSTMLGSAVKTVYQQFPECNRILVITDEQSADRPMHPQGKGYIVNVAANANGIGYGPWVTIDGWSEAVLDFVRENEAETTSTPES